MWREWSRSGEGGGLIGARVKIGVARRALPSPLGQTYHCLSIPPLLPTSISTILFGKAVLLLACSLCYCCCWREKRKRECARNDSFLLDVFGPVWKSMGNGKRGSCYREFLSFSFSLSPLSYSLIIFSSRSFSLSFSLSLSRLFPAENNIHKRFRKKERVNGREIKQRHCEFSE